MSQSNWADIEVEWKDSHEKHKKSGKGCVEDCPICEEEEQMLMEGHKEALKKDDYI